MKSVHAALPAAIQRLRALVDGASPDTQVTREWTIGDTLAHLTGIAAKDVALIVGRPPDLPVLGLRDLVATATVDTIHVMNAQILAHFPERDPGKLLHRLIRDVDELVREADPAGVVPWLGGARLPVGGLLAHLLNEVNIHAWDIARAVGRPWHTPAADAAFFLNLFLVGVVESGYGRLLDQDRPSYPGRIEVTFRGQAGAPFTLVADRGQVHQVPLAERPDVLLTFDPVTFNLMLFGRVSRLRAGLTGKVRVGGRRPWLLPAFLRTMRLPS